MKLFIVGATGSVGSRIVDEALERGHEVTAVARRTGAVSARPGLTVASGDVALPQSLANQMRGHDVVVSSVRFVNFNLSDLLESIRLAGSPRLIMVGGAGSLKTADGTLLVDTPTFPEVAKAEARAGAEKFRELREATDLDWTFISPSAIFTPGDRLGRYRESGDDLLVGQDGRSRISQEDYAIAMLDEIESPKHRGERFTVGY
ncbi:NAD(P)-dependent oxidoreductase [Paraburkholderia tropica]|uniref:NAD(P)-dependent oxidoreductase n=1 Tax=Paraburkholderia tropica TaxID=92647 RepID=UPI002AB68C04|nr:NAD(P)-dependent oxidoreductase [Paraburkholderia tropica]